MVPLQRAIQAAAIGEQDSEGVEVEIDNSLSSCKSVNSGINNFSATFDVDVPVKAANFELTKRMVD